MKKHPIYDDGTMEAMRKICKNLESGHLTVQELRQIAKRTGYEAGTPVLSRDGKVEGVAMGSRRRCQMEGCTGRRLGVRWPRKGGKARTTYPCTKGMDFDGLKWRIL